MLQQRGSVAPTRVTRGRRLDWFGPGLALVGVGIFLLHGFGGLLTRDLALYAYAGQQFAEGVPPYEGVVNRAGPLAHMVPGFGVMIARTLGTDDLITMRVLMMVLSAIAVWVTYLLGRDTFRSRLAGVATAATLLTFQGFVTYATGGPREKTTMMLLVALALLALVHRRWAWAGAAIALATLTWQPAFWAGAAAAVGAILLSGRGRRVRGLVGFALGGIAATAMMTAYFWWADALEAFFDGFLFLNATSTRQVGLVEFVLTDPGAMLEGFGWSLWLLLAGLVGAIGAGVVVWRSPHRHEPHLAARVGVAAGTVGYTAWAFGVFNGWADAVVLLPFAAIGVGGVVHLAVRHLDTRTATRLVAAYAVVVLVATAVDTWVTRPDELAPMRAETEAVLAATGPHTTVLSVGAPQPLVFGQLRNPLQHQMFIGGLAEYLDETWPGGLEAMAAVVDRDTPTFITMDHPSWYGWLRPVLLEKYRKIGTTLDFTWYVERSVGEEKISELTRILASGP